MGYPFMPWQAHWALVAGEMIRDEETGLWVPAYPEAFATLMRQQGKTHWELSVAWDRALLWEPFDGKPQAISYTGQTGSAGRKKFRKDHIPMLKRSPLWRHVAQARFAAEDTGLDFHNGATYQIWSTSEEEGHSLVIDLAVMDEIWADTDTRREQAAIPAMATRHDSQKIMTSTGGTDKSVLYLRKQRAGRQAVLDGRTEGMAYLEFSADPDDDPEDPKTWRSCMPALGHTITERTVRSALDQMREEHGDLREFSRAWLNISVRSVARVISAESWRAVSGDHKPEDPLTFGIDAPPEQEAASVVAADSQGRVELVARDDGIGWLVDRVPKIAGKRPVVLDERGPLGHLYDDLEAAGVAVIAYKTGEYADACASTYQAITEGRLGVRSHVAFDEAVAAAKKRSLGDRWLWARRDIDSDISPLVALTLAVAEATKAEPPPRRPIAIVT